MAISQGTKSAKTASAIHYSHPPYIDMITQALVSLKERTGSSPYAIAKHIEEQQKVRDLPPNFKKLLFIQLKKFVASGKLLKVKNSFKLPSKKSPAAESKPKPKTKEVAGKTKKKEAAKPKKPAATKKGKAVKVKSPMKKLTPVKAKKPKTVKSPAKKANK